MLKRTLAAALMAGLGVWVIASCGSSTQEAGPTGTVYTFISDLPFCNVANFHANITGLTLIGPNGTPVQPVFPAGLRSPDYKINFGQLRDFNALLDISKVPVGTWVQAKIMFSVGEVAMVDFTKNPPITVLNGNFTTTTPIVNISPPLVVSANTVSALNIDLNMAQSLLADASGNITGGVQPSISVTTLSSSAINGFATTDDVVGFVTSVTTTAGTGSSFAGGFGFQTLMSSGALYTVNLVNTTQVCGISNPGGPYCAPAISPGCSQNGGEVTCPVGVTQWVNLNRLLTGSLVEANAYTDSNGNVVANTVEVEDQEVQEENKLGFIGNIISVNRTQSGNVNQFNMYVGDIEPDSETQVTQDSVVTVNLDSSTVFRCTTCNLNPAAWPTYPAYSSLNFANLPFNASALAPGQEVFVQGVATKSNSPTLPATIASDPTNQLLLTIYLKPQSHQGTFASLVTAESDDRTGAFWMASCSVLFQGAPVFVATNATTTFVNATGLTALNSQSPVLVKGLLFNEQYGATINGVTVPAGTLVMLAEEVHAL